MISDKEDQTQKTIRGYRLLRKIGSGATANVFKAQNYHEFSTVVLQQLNAVSVDLRVSRISAI